MGRGGKGVEGWREGWKRRTGRTRLHWFFWQGVRLVDENLGSEYGGGGGTPKRYITAKTGLRRVTNSLCSLRNGGGPCSCHIGRMTQFSSRGTAERMGIKDKYSRQPEGGTIHLRGEKKLWVEGGGGSELGLPAPICYGTGGYGRGVHLRRRNNSVREPRGSLPFRCE